MWTKGTFAFSFLLNCLTANCLDCIKQNGVVIEAKLTTPINWIKDAINAHNNYRFDHDSAPLVFNESLCRSAQWTANTNLKIGFMHTSKMPGSYSMSCGENLYTSATVGNLVIRKGHEPIESWYSEELDYDYERGMTKVLNKPVGHFTQLVWKASKQVCVAYAYDGGRFFVAAHYFPRGNVRKRYVENVGLRKAAVPKPKVPLNPWVEIMCDKIKGKPFEYRRFKCHYKGTFIQLSPKKSLPISRKESKKLLDKILSTNKISAFLEVSTKNKQ